MYTHISNVHHNNIAKKIKIKIKFLKYSEKNTHGIRKQRYISYRFIILNYANQKTMEQHFKQLQEKNLSM